MQELLNSVIQNIHPVEIHTNTSKYHRLVGHGPWKESRDWLSLGFLLLLKEYLSVQRWGELPAWASGKAAA